MNRKEKVLIVDDEKIIRESLRHWFEDLRYHVETADSGPSALKKFIREKFSLLLIDMEMPGMNGLELLKRVKEIDKDTIVIMITAFATVSSAIAALKDGAFDYVTKPVYPDKLAHLVEKAIEQRKLTLENKLLKENLVELSGQENLIGESFQMKKVYEMISTAAMSDTAVIIRGERGTGKELIAKAIHINSRRKYFPFISIKCGALTESMLEKELFGEEPVEQDGNQILAKGKFEIVEGGTIYLDEVNSISQKLQVEIFNVLETQQFFRMSGKKQIKTSFRLITATNEDIENLIKDGKFREDLYYKLNIFPIPLPPLRERKGDIVLLVHEFIEKISMHLNKPVKEVSQEAIEFLVNYDWPGNVRELENAIERALVIGKSEKIIVNDLPIQITSTQIDPENDKKSLSAVEKKHILKILNENNWNISRSAQVLEIDRVTLYNKINKYSLRARQSN